MFNGGAWVEVDGRKVDVHYRDLSDVERRVADAERGAFEIEHPSFYLAGIPSYVVVAELGLGRVLFGTLPRPVFSKELMRPAAASWQRRAEMTLDYAESAHASRGDAIAVAGSMARALLEASHARMAARGTWATNEKNMVARAGFGHAALFFRQFDAEPANLRATIQLVREALSPIVQ